MQHTANGFVELSMMLSTALACDDYKEKTKENIKNNLYT